MLGLSLRNRPRALSPTNGSARVNRAPIVCALLLALSTIGCAGHAAKTIEARDALDANQPTRALKLYNEVLEVKSATELPAKDKNDSALFVLDRSMISQQLADYQSSSRDLQHSDKAVEMLDMSRTAVADIGKYLFSDDSGPYRAAPYEKVMINTMNMVNYLAAHDLSGARVEARRLSIMQKYLRENNNAASSMNAPGGYLAGFVFERSGRADIALRYYDEALEYGDFPSLVRPIAALMQKSPYSTPRLLKFLEKYGVSSGAPASAATQGSQANASTPAAASGSAPPNATQAPATTTAATTTTQAPPANPATTSATAPATQAGEPAPATPQSGPIPIVTRPAPDEPGELLVVVNFGRVPARFAKRIPIGLALTYASMFMTGPDQNSANKLAAQGLVTWINYPELEEGVRRMTVPTLQVDGTAYALDTAGFVDVAARSAFDKERGPIIASAITRMVARIIAGQAAGAAARGASNDDLIGTLVSLGTQAALSAADTPDTRSWATLPARVAVARIPVAPGRHRIVTSAQGVTKTTDLTMSPGGWQVVNLTILR